MPQQQQKTVIWLDMVGAFGLLAITGYLDYATGYGNTFFVFYLVPIIFTFLRVGVGRAVGMCLLSALVWLGSNLIAGQTYTIWLALLWDMSARLAVFLLVVALFTLRRNLHTKVRQSHTALNREIQARSRLEKELLEASEREQRRIGQDLHDSLCQHLTATALAGKVLAKKLAGQSRPEAEVAEQVVGMIEKGIELTRTLARNLHPVEMRAEGLVDALQELAANINKGSPVTCRLECRQSVSLATADDNMQLYRIAQEAISNAIRHGQAKNITLALEEAGGAIVLVITDDGAGLPADAWGRKGMGLRSMRYRADMIGGELQVERLPVRGTRVTCRLREGRPCFGEAYDRQP